MSEMLIDSISATIYSLLIATNFFYFCVRPAKAYESDSDREKSPRMPITLGDEMHEIEEILPADSIIIDPLTISTDTLLDEDLYIEEEVTDQSVTQTSTTGAPHHHHHGDDGAHGGEEVVDQIIFEEDDDNESIASEGDEQMGPKGGLMDTESVMV